MTFAPIPIINATLNALQAHGIELPAVSTRIVAPYDGKVYVDLDLSNGDDGAHMSTDLRNLIPAQFFHNGDPDNSYWIGHLRLMTTEVTFRFYEFDQDGFYA